MSDCPWYVSAAAVRAWQALRRDAPRDFDDASDALIELCAETYRERYSPESGRAPGVTRTGAYVYRTTPRHGRLQLIVSPRSEGEKMALVDVLPESTARRGR